MCFQKKQEKHDEYKAGKHWLLILSVGSIAWKELLDISADYMTNNTGV